MINTAQPTFYIGSVPVFGDLVLAPMDGYSDPPFRQLMRDHGSALSYSMFLNGIDLMNGHPYLEKRLVFSETERPFIYQLFDNDIERLITSALKVQQRNPDVIDINLGCSAPHVFSRGAGAALLKDVSKIAGLFKTLSGLLSCPVTAKIRLGLDDDNLNYMEVARALEDNGAAMIVVHGRTRKQKFNLPAVWEPIAEVKAALHIPVIGNGDVQTVADIDRMKQTTGCNAVMIGRAAIGNPWLFSRRCRLSIPNMEVLSVIKRHFAGMLDFYGVEIGVFRFRKHLNGYLRPYAYSRELRLRLMSIKDPAELLDVLENNLPTMEYKPEETL